MRCIDFTDHSTFRAYLNGNRDACECGPYEADDMTALTWRSANTIADSVFDISAPSNSACKCVTGKYTSTSSGTLLCLECSPSAGFLGDFTLLTDCLSATTQCEPRGFSTVFEDTFDHFNPVVRCGCDTSKNFFDNIAVGMDVEGCFCNLNDNWWTLTSSGEYQPIDYYEHDIDYSDIS